MNDKAERLLARNQEALEKGASAMWRTALADTVMTLLNRDGTLDRDSLRAELEARRDAANEARYERSIIQGAINAVDGRAPKE